ncbi:tetratricopeptide repeat protein [Croceibacterium aestuarii]|uniref:tetratricopeptide repeat protein n=1 Tax=Croceibacterium aestuarii TaxID=3064139 RepID=UPI00272DED79|nr:tetratricopeptide repeat protein [Croceibacterium sp. D39]
MRYTPAALALSLLIGVTASVGMAEDLQTDPRSAALEAQGRSQLQAGQLQMAVDSFEAALVIDPANTRVYLDLAAAARAQGLQGKAIHYYREALERDPKNFAALSGEGEAMLEKGAVEKARRNLAQLESLCGAQCSESRELAAAIERGPVTGTLTAEAVMPEPVVTQN